MAEAIAAFGLAANVIQFIDVGSRIATNMWGFYKGKGPAFYDMLDVDSINFDLQKILLGLDNGSTESPATADRGLVRLAKEYRNSANMLDNKLRPLLKVRSQARGKREAFKDALRLTWNEDDIRSLEKRLNGFRHQLTLHLLSSLRYYSISDS
jgi:hypothetical protein